MSTIAFFLSAFVAEVLGITIGFGSGLIFLPLALLFVDLPNALTLAGVMHLFGYIPRAHIFRDGLDRRLLVSFGLPSVIAAAFGALLVPYLSRGSLTTFLGLFLIGFALAAFARGGMRLSAESHSAALGGGLSGFLAGVIGTGGALRAALFKAFESHRGRYIATSAVVAIAVDLTRVTIYLANGFLDTRYAWYVPVLAVVAYCGSLTSVRILDRAPSRLYRDVVLAAIMVLGVKFAAGW